jgi:hypothetical protein
MLMATSLLTQSYRRRQDTDKPVLHHPQCQDITQDAVPSMNLVMSSLLARTWRTAHCDQGIVKLAVVPRRATSRAIEVLLSALRCMQPSTVRGADALLERRVQTDADAQAMHRRRQS